jgi:hypothetical protein
VRDVVFSTMLFEADAALLERWGETVERAPRELTSFLMLGGGAVQLYTVYGSDDTAAAVDALTPLLEIGKLLDQSAQLAPYPAIVAPQGAVHAGGSRRPALRSGLLDHVTAAAAEGMMRLARSGSVPLLQIRSVGGAVNDLAPDATAYAHRTQNFAPGAVGTSVARLNALWDEEIAPHTRGLYLSFDTDERPERLHDAFPGETLVRLRELKARYDPDNVFNQNFPIAPAPVSPAPLEVV